MRLENLLSLVLLGLLGCPSPEAPSSVSSRPSEPEPPASGVGAALDSATASPAPADARGPGQPYPCAALVCRDFESAEKALTVVLDETKPAIVAFGESHALKGTEGVKSTTARFTDELLPLFRDRASALVLELWAPDPKCNKEKVADVAQKQKVVTEKQAGSNQNEFVKLGEKSRSVGVVPFLLKPTCDDYDKVRSAGDDAVLAMLDVVTRNMKDKAVTLFHETEKKAPGKMLLTYGGALHNDVAPRKDREAWSFAADLDKLAPGRFVEVDLVVPEFIKDTPAWTSLPWFSAYDRGQARRVVLITVGPRSFVLLFAPSVTGD